MKIAIAACLVASAAAFSQVRSFHVGLCSIAESWGGFGASFTLTSRPVCLAAPSVPSEVAQLAWNHDVGNEVSQSTCDMLG